MDKFLDLPQHGFAMTSTAVEFMQNAYGAFEQLAALAGNGVIISGIERDSEGNVSPGWAVLDNKLCYCEGGVGRFLKGVPVETITEIADSGGTRKQVTYRAVVDESYIPGDIELIYGNHNRVRFTGGVVGLGGLQMEGVEISNIDMSQSSVVGFGGDWRGAFRNLISASVMVWRDSEDQCYPGDSGYLPAPISVGITRQSEGSFSFALNWDNTAGWGGYVDKTKRRFTVTFLWAAGDNLYKMPSV